MHSTALGIATCSTLGRPPRASIHWREGGFVDDETRLSIIRRAYARNVLFAACVSKQPELEEAFATVRREVFLGPGPWSIFRAGHFSKTPDDDPVHVYVDWPFAIDVGRRINNGQPSLHAALIGHARPRKGERIVHVGAGTGYFTAILAHLAGPSGRVEAIEVETDLAARAASNLTDRGHVRVQRGDGTILPMTEADVIYVNAGVTRPPDAWLDALADGGRLILPLTTNKGFRAGEPSLVARRGAVVLVERRGDDYLATCISAVEIFPCVGARDAESETALEAAFARGPADRIRRLHRHAEIDESKCWLRAKSWCLAYE
jgi:protein-L-isoaspartate(D-aspartate) O-methyltransferase